MPDPQNLALSHCHVLPSGPQLSPPSTEQIPTLGERALPSKIILIMDFTPNNCAYTIFKRMVIMLKASLCLDVY